MTETEKTFTKTIHSMERLRNSTNGNPTWRLTFNDGATADTAADASVAYVIENSEYQNTPVKFTTDGRGKVIKAKPLTD